MIRLASVFQSGMVLQRGKPITVFGESDSAQSVAVFLGETALTTLSITAGGAFRAELPALSAAEDQTLRFVCADGELTLEQVDIGEVWLAGGQSNMEFFLRYDAEAKAALAGANDAHLRMYTVAQYAFDGEEHDSFKDDRLWNRWLPAESATAETFSAVAYYFARVLRKTLNVPIGILNCNWGGTTASTWLEESYLRQNEALRVYLSDFAQATEGQDFAAYCAADRAFRGRKQTYRDRLLIYKMYGTHGLWCRLLEKYICSGPIQPMGPRHHNSPARLYETMLRKIAGYGMRGVIWYQGESDCPHPDVYAQLFTETIACWRRDWGEELPFLFVQLAPFESDCGFDAKDFPEIRRQQELVEKTVPAAWMTSIMDVGMRRDIHPKKKRPVGERLALLALGKVYGKALLCEEPKLLSAEKTPDGLRLHFDHAGEGLFIRGRRLNAISVFADGKAVKNRRAAAKGNCLMLACAQLHDAKKIRLDFAQTPYCKVNLYNSANLPARPFSFEINGGTQ